MHYVIFLGEKTSWFLEEEMLFQKLLKKWPKARIEKSISKQPLTQLTWDTLTETSGIYGSLGDDGKTLRIEGYPKELAEFMVWFQKEYPEQNFWVTDKSFDYHIRLTEKMDANLIPGEELP